MAGRTRENPRYEIVSMRVSDDEREALQYWMERQQASISDLLRAATEAAGFFTKEGK
ncbi:MAG: hypothetical protein FD174_2609 [Geobacteraceae bacterium]|nr:MAG: hypothetical protein FD174_2609 [Geobacteraceae bacterium]